MLSLGVGDHEHPGVSALANRFMGQTLLFMGAFDDARAHLNQTLDLCAANPETIATYRRFGVDDQVNALSFLAVAFLLLGYPEQSAAAAEKAENSRSIDRARFHDRPGLGQYGCPWHDRW